MTPTPTPDGAAGGASRRDLPEGVIDADPPGGWEDVSDRETDERNRDAAGSPELVTSDEPSKGADPDLSLGEES